MKIWRPHPIEWLKGIPTYIKHLGRLHKKYRDDMYFKLMKRNYGEPPAGEKIEFFSESGKR